MPEALDLGPVRRWKQGDILYAENKLMRSAYVVSDETNVIGTVGWYPCKDGEIWVEFISAKHASDWEKD